MTWALLLGIFCLRLISEMFQPLRVPSNISRMEEARSIDVACGFKASGTANLRVQGLSKIVDERLKKCQSGSCHTEVTPLPKPVDSNSGKPNLLILKGAKQCVRSRIPPDCLRI